MTLQLGALLLKGPGNNGMKKNKETGIAILQCQSLEIFVHHILHLAQVSKTILLRCLYHGKQLIATEMQCEVSSETEYIFFN